MLTAEQYREAMRALTTAQALEGIAAIRKAKDAFDGNNPMSAMAEALKTLQGVDGSLGSWGITIDLTRSAWDLTRPETTARVFDLLPRLRHDYPDLAEEVDAKMETCTFVHIMYLGESGEMESLIAYTGGDKKRDSSGEPMDNPSEALDAAVCELADKVGKEEGIEKDALVATDPGKVMKDILPRGRNSAPDVDSQVDKFRSEMDDIFSTWAGGEGG